LLLLLLALLAQHSLLLLPLPQALSTLSRN
jgi:hypothetical protein